MKTQSDLEAASVQDATVLTEQELSSTQGGMIRINPPPAPRRPPGWLGIDPILPTPRPRTQWQILIDGARLVVS